jgi:CRISPR-associated protein Cas6
MDISPESLLTLGKRRTIRIKDKEVVGYEVLIERLSASESLILQGTGLGGRRHMGCGLFSPVMERGAVQ